MSIKFSVKMNEKYMYDFFLYNIYSRISGILMLILGGIALAMSIRTWITSSFTMAMPTMIVAVLLLVVNPMNTKSSAKMQVKNTPMFQKPLDYELNETGIIIRQDDAEATNRWEDIAKAVSTRKSIIVYMNRVRALIMPRECMGEQCDAVIEMIRAHVPAKKVRIK